MRRVSPSAYRRRIDFQLYLLAAYYLIENIYTRARARAVHSLYYIAIILLIERNYAINIIVVIARVTGGRGGEGTTPKLLSRALFFSR